MAQENPATLRHGHQQQALQAQIETLRQDLSSTRARHRTLRHQFDELSNHFQAAEEKVRRLEGENQAIRVYEEEYKTQLGNAVRMSMVREVHVEVLEHENAALKAQAVELYKRKAEAERLLQVATATQRQDLDVQNEWAAGPGH